MKHSSRNVRILVLIAVLLVILAYYILSNMGKESTDDAALEAHIVTLSPKVGGYIKTLYVDDNTLVKAGDVILEIDPADYIIRRDHALAALEAARAGHAVSSQNLDTTMISAPSSLEAAQAQVDAAEANWHKASNDLKRMQSLSSEARSREQLDAMVAAEKTARSSLEDAKARLRSAKTAPRVIASAQANANNTAAMIKEAEANLAQAEKDLNDTKIVAPMEGRITRKGVEKGDYVNPGQQLGSLVGLEFWVVANFKETQLKNMHKGSRAALTVDAFPKLKLGGHIDSIQSGTGSRFSAFPAENATGNFVKVVQRVPVKILLDNPPGSDTPLGAGMSVNATVYDK